MGASSNNAWNLFEVENARNLTRDQLVQTFVPTESFWRLLSRSNHIVLGVRGSGKTALAKMLSHDHLSKMNHDKAHRAIEAHDFIGTYVSTRVEWVSGLKNKPWSAMHEKEAFFQWKLNLALVAASTYTLQSCLESYFSDQRQRVFKERALVEDICRSLNIAPLDRPSFPTFRRALAATDFKNEVAIATAMVRGDSIAVGEVLPTMRMELFVPFRRIVSLAQEHLGIAEHAAWLVCIDEAEYLDVDHQRMLNSYMRANSGPLFFKITTMPYHHKTLATNINTTLQSGHDFEYLPVSADSHESASDAHGEQERFAEKVFSARLGASGIAAKSLTLEKFLGASELLDETDANWSRGDCLWRLMERHCNEETKERCARLSVDPVRFGDSVGRKLRGMLMLREAVAQLKGNTKLTVYSGRSMVVRCSDGNPRILIRVLNELLNKAGAHSWKRDEDATESPRTIQNQALASVGASLLSSVPSEPDVGPQLHRILNMIGEWMNERLHGAPIGTDSWSSILVSEETAADKRSAIQAAVALGLMYPNRSQNSTSTYNATVGVFHLAFVLAPHFRLLPRRGRSMRLERILIPDRHKLSGNPTLFVEKEDSDGHHEDS